MAVYASPHAWSYTGTESQGNASYIYSYLKGKGWSRNAILGLICNTTWESYNNPAFHEQGGTGFGIVQWTPSNRYTTWATQHGYPCGADVSNPEKYLLGQLEKIIDEYNKGQEFMWGRNSHVYRNRFDGTTWETFIHTTNSVAWATEAWMACYERPSYTLHHLDDRLSFISFWEQKLTDSGEAQGDTYAEGAVKWAVAIANDDNAYLDEPLGTSHGYDQNNRQGPDYDCSSLVINAYQEAGVDVKGHGASYTGDMYDAFIASGFRDVTSEVDFKTGSGLIAGDVLVNTAHHAALAIGGGQIVQASINEKGTVTGGKTGDQTGHEIWVRSYYNFPWNYVLRIDGYSGFGQPSAASGVSVVRAVPVTQKSWTEYEYRA